MLKKITLTDAFAKFSEPWSPKVAGDVNQMQVKLAKFEGEFIWHHHENEDEFFLVVRGTIRIDLEDGAVELGEGEMVIVPRGIEHRPVGLPTAEVLMFESSDTVNTGNAGGDRTILDLDRLDSL